MPITPEWVKLREQGWTFMYDSQTRFLAAEHPSGGKISIAEFCLQTGDKKTLAHQIGYTLVDFLNDEVATCGLCDDPYPSQSK